MSNPSLKRGRLIIGGLVLLLIILHQDTWNWDSRTLVFGFMPLTLFYHVCISLGASAVWYLATVIAWPVEIEEAVATSDSSDAGTGGEA